MLSWLTGRLFGSFGLQESWQQVIQFWSLLLQQTALQLTNNQNMFGFWHKLKKFKFLKKQPTTWCFVIFANKSKTGMTNLNADFNFLAFSNFFLPYAMIYNSLKSKH